MNFMTAGEVLSNKECNCSSTAESKAEQTIQLYKPLDNAYNDYIASKPGLEISMLLIHVNVQHV